MARWFGPKRIGWGIRPASPIGWGIVVLYVVVLGFGFVVVGGDAGWILFAVATVVLFATMLFTTGSGPASPPG